MEVFICLKWLWRYIVGLYVNENYDCETDFGMK